MERLRFIETFSVAEFKAQNGVNRIEVKQNPSTGKCFFAFGFETGAVSSGFLSGKIDHPVISHVCVPETGDLFYLLHQQGQNNVTTLAVL
ncbi:MAG: hypothetical protein IJ140_06040 [Prevotella sp.]|nr:hypothetical protein [Prevotella sp.]